MSEEISTGASDGGSAAGSPQNAAAESAASDFTEGAQMNPASAEASVPVSVLQALRREMGNLREQNRLYQAALLAGQKGGASAPKGASSNPSDDAPASLGHLRPLAERLDRVSREMAYMRFSGDHPGFIEAVNTHLPGMVRENPGLLKALMASPNPLASAFDMVARSDAYKAAQAKAAAKGPDDLARTVERIVKNAEKAGGTGAGGRAPFSSAERIRNMSAEEFRELTERIKSQG